MGEHSHEVNDKINHYEGLEEINESDEYNHDHKHIHDGTDLNNIKHDESIKLLNPNIPNKLHKSVNLTNSMLKNSLLLKTYNKKDYNEVVNSMLDKKKSLIFNIEQQKKISNENTNTHDHSHSDEEKLDNSKTTAIVLSLALLVHNLFEGMAIGMSPDLSKLVTMVVASCSHKFIEAFSLGLSFLEANWFDCSS